MEFRDSSLVSGVGLLLVLDVRGNLHNIYTEKKKTKAEEARRNWGLVFFAVAHYTQISLTGENAGKQQIGRAQESELELSTILSQRITPWKAELL